ncbi:uncharacterized protein LOC128958993 [Oppia nitens]|uniref:uncharacterized protein LOC128958993 n=1 Tax=Oppia nitens TaxID=1686743 RepID=UPI0023DA2EB2|nr:uncharacterized protein LOC128958993 [Oppia nitens]
MSIIREDFGLVSMDSKLYAIGGYDSKSRVNSLEVYDTQTNTWKLVSSMNLLRNELDSAIVNNTIYVCGGLGDYKIFKSCEYYSPNIDKWQSTTAMNVERYGLGLVSIGDRFLYAIGGRNGNGYLNSMEMFDTKSKQWIPKENMIYQRQDFGSVSFMGKIYVCGGWGTSDGKSCETYDPQTNQWKPIASMKTQRANFKLIAIDENLYALGGYSSTDQVYTDSVEIYDHNSNQWSYTTLLPHKMRSFGILLLIITCNAISLNTITNTTTTTYNISNLTENLSEKFIYICGGNDGSKYLAECYEYNKHINVWQSIQSMSTIRSDFGLVSLNSKLYAMGGYNYGESLNSVETYDTQTNTWKSISSMNILRYEFDSAVVNNTIYVCGGRNDKYFKSCEYYSLNINLWYLTTPMNVERCGLGLVSHEGFLYAIGGYNGNDFMNSMEMFDTKTKQWIPKANMGYQRADFGSVSFMGKIYVCGGEGNSDGKSCETYDPKTNQWTSIVRYYIKLIIDWHIKLIACYYYKDKYLTENQLSEKFIYICGGFDLITPYTSKCYKYNNHLDVWQSIQSMSTERMNFGLVSMDSKLYAIGGENIKTVETYDTLTNIWKSVSSMNIIRNDFGSAIINNTIYVCGGENDKYLKSCEYYSSNIDKWFSTTPMISERSGFELISIGDRFMYAIGGYNGKDLMNSMEMFDINTKQWTPKANMQSSRYSFGSALFMGKIYVCGGLGTSDENSCETYDPQTNQWTPIGIVYLDEDDGFSCNYYTYCKEWNQFCKQEVNANNEIVGKCHDCPYNTFLCGHTTCCEVDQECKHNGEIVSCVATNYK